MRKFSSFLVVIALLLPVLCTPISAVEYGTVEYIVDNIDMLSEVYELLNPNSEEVFAGTYVERMIPVQIISTNLPGTYIDFDGNNGYMVVQDDNAVIAWEVSGDLEYLQELEIIFYSVVDGFLYIEDGDYVPFDAEIIDAESSEVETPYTGPGTNSTGTIYDVYTYVTNRYPGYDFVDSEYLNVTFEYVSQDDYTVYRYNNVGEGNCALSCVYALLNYFGISRQCNFPSSSSPRICYPQNDPFYELYNGVEGYVIPYCVTLPQLYYTIRDVAIEDYGYERSGFNTRAIPGLIERVADLYSNHINATLPLVGTFDSCVVPAMERDTPAILAVSENSVYSNHAVVVTGYQIYRETTTILGINFYEYLYILRINDNWGAEPRYFDLNAHSGGTQYITVEVRS